MDPYEARADKIPQNDLYADLPLYGRYHPTPQDFIPEAEFCNPNATSSAQYWTKVLDSCGEEQHVYPNPFGGRSVFALGTVIVKSKHLTIINSERGVESNRVYSFGDANEVAALQLVPKSIPTRRVFFQGHIKDCDVLIQSRAAGVALNIAWPYLSQRQKQLFKEQARDILRIMRSVPVPHSVTKPGYFVPDPSPAVNRNIRSEEIKLLFHENNSTNSNTALCFMHNDFQPSNIIVKDDKIVAVIDWEHAGWFSWDSVKTVHSRFRCPSRDDFANTHLSEAEIDDKIFWGDLYDFDD